jgi:hypothetical protein
VVRDEDAELAIHASVAQVLQRAVALRSSEVLDPRVRRHRGGADGLRMSEGGSERHRVLRERGGRHHDVGASIGQLVERGEDRPVHLQPEHPDEEAPSHGRLEGRTRGALVQELLHLALHGHAIDAAASPREEHLAEPHRASRSATIRAKETNGEPDQQDVEAVALEKGPVEVDEYDHALISHQWTMVR